jgi:hypothetical protein
MRDLKEICYGAFAAASNEDDFQIGLTKHEYITIEMMKVLLGKDSSFAASQFDAGMHILARQAVEIAAIVMEETSLFRAIVVEEASFFREEHEKIRDAKIQALREKIRGARQEQQSSGPELDF